MWSFDQSDARTSSGRTSKSGLDAQGLAAQIPAPGTNHCLIYCLSIVEKLSLETLFLCRIQSKMMTHHIAKTMQKANYNWTAFLKKNDEFCRFALDQCHRDLSWCQ